MNQQMYTVSPEFKSRATTILNTKKFSTVFPFMNLINRDGFQYNETELNQLIQFLGEFPYSEVSEFFGLIPSMVKKNEETEQTAVTPQTEGSFTANLEPITETAV